MPSPDTLVILIAVVCFISTVGAIWAVVLDIRSTWDRTKPPLTRKQKWAIGLTFSPLLLILGPLVIAGFWPDSSWPMDIWAICYFLTIPLCIYLLRSKRMKELDKALSERGLK